MKKKRINSGSTFENEIAYSRAIVVGQWIFVSGTTGFNYETMTISNDIVEQTEQCIKNIENALIDTESSLNDIVKVTYIVPEVNEFSKCWETLRKHFNEIRPAATMISANLADPRMKIEIEVIAIKDN